VLESKHLKHFNDWRPMLRSDWACYGVHTKQKLHHCPFTPSMFLPYFLLLLWSGLLCFCVMLCSVRMCITSTLR
jgi:hypothetical protein